MFNGDWIFLYLEVILAINWTFCLYKVFWNEIEEKTFEAWTQSEKRLPKQTQFLPKVIFSHFGTYLNLNPKNLF